MCALRGLVALRDIAPGEQLPRDYGAAWWREVAWVWEVARDEGCRERRCGTVQRLEPYHRNAQCAATQVTVASRTGSGRRRASAGAD